MIVQMWMTRSPHTVGPDTPITEAATIMAKHHIRRLPVLKATLDKNILVGILAAKDVLQAFPPAVDPYSWESRAGQIQDQLGVVEQIMSRQVYTTTPLTPLEEAALVMRNNKVGVLPVLKGDELVGIITESDIFRAFISMLRVEEEGVRATFELAENNDELACTLDLARRHRMKLVSFLTLDHEEQHLGVARVLGKDTDSFIDELWSTGHRVLTVQRAGKQA